MLYMYIEVNTNEHGTRGNISTLHGYTSYYTTVLLLSFWSKKSILKYESFPVVHLMQSSDQIMHIGQPL